MPKTRLDTICTVTCYKQPDYVRSVTLAEGLKQGKAFAHVIEVRNTSTGFWRYVEVVVRLLRVRFTQNPGTYLVTFRGYEILPLVLLVGIGKKVVYDEFINPVEWFVYEHKKFGPHSLLAMLLRASYRFLGNRASTILTDTPSHAAYSAALMGLPLRKYFSVPVSTDEQLFHPDKKHGEPGVFTVLYCGNMLPLYGVEYVLEAAVALADRSDIRFHIVGGKKALAEQVDMAIQKGAHIIYESWVPYREFPALFHSSDLCLGGPFGDTVQSRFVITGKTFQFLAAALPVVVGNNQEAHEFRDKHNVLIVPKADAGALQRTIEWAVAHPKELAQIAKKGRQLYEQKFSLARVARDLDRLFAQQ